jgi:hypothetical protein
MRVWDEEFLAVNCLANPVVFARARHNHAVGALITMTVMSAGWTARLGTVSIDFVFSIGCCAVAWEMRKIAEPLINRQKEIKAEITNG